MSFIIGEYVLDPDRRELRRGDQAIAIEPQVFDLIEYLIRQRDRVVTRDDLIASVWQGRIVSDSTLATRINAARRALMDDGEQQRLIRTIMRKGFRFVGEVREEAASTAAAEREPAPLQQEVTFCRTADGVSLAMAICGAGPVLVKTANWLNHLEYDWQSPIWAPLLHSLARRFRLVRYDARGNGLSDWQIDEIAFATFERDLETIVTTLQLDRYALFGISQGAATAVVHAVQHPERITRMVLYGGYALGRNKRPDPADREVAQAYLSMMRHGWGDEHSAFMRMFSAMYLPNGTREQIRAFADMQRAATSGENAVRLRAACDDIDIVPLLPQVRVPTLVLHSRHDNVAPYEQGRLLAASIPNATFVTLDSDNHVLLPDEPAWQVMVREIKSFLAAG